MLLKCNLVSKYIFFILENCLQEYTKSVELLNSLYDTPCNICFGDICISSFQDEQTPTTVSQATVLSMDARTHLLDPQVAASDHSDPSYQMKVAVSAEINSKISSSAESTANNESRNKPSSKTPSKNIVKTPLKIFKTPVRGAASSPKPFCLNAMKTPVYKTPTGTPPIVYTSALYGSPQLECSGTTSCPCCCLTADDSVFASPAEGASHQHSPLFRQQQQDTPVFRMTFQDTPESAAPPRPICPNSPPAPPNRLDQYIIVDYQVTSSDQYKLVSTSTN